MRLPKLALFSVAVALAGLISFWVGESTRTPSTVGAQAGGTVFPKVEIHLTVSGVRGSYPLGVQDLGAECEVIEFREGGDNGTVRKLPGRLKWDDIVLKRGPNGDALGDPFLDEMYKWYRDTAAGDLERKNGSLIMYDADGGAEIGRYEFFDAWPCKWKGFSLDGKSESSGREEFSLTYSKVTYRSRDQN